MAAVRVERLDVVRGNTHALRSVSLDVEPRTVTGLLGPSGSGKTTLIRAIVGVQVIRSGAVEVLGVPAGSPELRPRVGYVTQAPSVYSDLTARENLDYFRRIAGAPGSRIDEVLETVDLQARADNVVSTMSGGAGGRGARAAPGGRGPARRGLAGPPGGGAPGRRRDLWNMFHRLADEGATLLVSSHVMDEADRCDSLILIRDGRIVAQDQPDELRRRTGEQDLEKAFLAIVEGGL